MSQLAMSSPDMQVRVNSSNNLGKKRGWSCERGGKKCGGGGGGGGEGRKRERERQEQKEDGGEEEEEKDEVVLGVQPLFPFESERSGPHADPGGLAVVGKKQQVPPTHQPIPTSLIIPNRQSSH